MDAKNFVWTSDLTKRLFKLRFENDWLFKKKKQPWREFRKILLDHGFPENMMVSHIRKKWSYTYDCYRLAKKTKNKSWRYYKIFDKHFGKTKILDKYENWPDEWRLKLITCISEAKELKVDFYDMWRTVEKAMRCQNLPNDCCIFDMKGLWHHIKITFNRKHRLKIKKGSEYSEWPLYDAMLDYYHRFEPDNLQRLETEPASDYYIKRRNNRHLKYNNQDVDKGNDVKEFHWSKDITETFIQIRLQNDWLFREKKWAWNDFLIIMTEEYGFPKTLTSKDIRRKWASTFSEYQKAKATNNKQWVYYTLFELYLGEGRLSLNPLVEWQEEWVFNLIRTRTDCEHMFKYRPNSKNHNEAWREVEKNLRSLGLPLDHSLLELPEIWAHLLKTYKWKQKFANKGMLSEQWPYYDAMAQYVEVSNSFDIKKQKEEMDDNFCHDDDDIEDDMKLFDLKQRLQVKPKLELLDVNQCRSCCNEDGCVNIFEQIDDKGLDLAHKLKVIGGIEVEKSDHLPTQICFNCLQELENAYRFRQKCQEMDQQLRKSGSPHSIKVEIKVDGVDQQRVNDAAKNTTIVENNDFGEMDSRYDVEFLSDTDHTQEKKPTMKKEKQKVAVRMRKKTANGRRKYEYWKVCEVCGKHTRNLRSHLDAHSTGKLYSCEVCDKKFKFKSGLIIHKAVHDPTPKKTCEICGKTFHILAQYRKHFVYHANERKFECETCGKRFNTLDILRVHRRMHTDERPFSCPECGKTFRTAGCVSRHRRIVHRKTIKIQ